MENSDIITNGAANTGYLDLVNEISSLWDNAKYRACTAVNGELLEANWNTGKYIVDFERTETKEPSMAANCSQGFQKT